MKVAICIPSYGDTKALFTQSLGTMLIYSMSQEVTYNGQPTRPTLHQLMMLGVPRVDRAREQLAEAALKHDPDYLLWLDADHTFPPDTLFRLMAHDLPLVGCNYRKRTGRDSSASKVEGGKSFRVEPKASGVEAVSVIGFGVCLMKAEVVRALPRPWFRMDDNGEDAYFCNQAQKIGAVPHVDHALSMEIGHVAETVVTLS